MLVSKFFYRRGGAEVHAIELERILAGRGLPTAVFAMAHPLNLSPSGALFTAPEVAIDGPLSRRIKGAMRVMGGFGVGSAFRKALHDFRPTVLLLHNIHYYISPIVAEIAAKRGVRVIWTLHDYKLLCPSYSFLRNGEECRECLTSPWPVIRHRCMKSSAVASGLALAEALRWNRRMTLRSVERFICPSRFMSERMTEGGYPPERLTVLHNFLTTPAPRLADGKNRSGVCYIGRLSAEKGVQTLLKCAVGAPWHLTIAGTGPLENELRKSYASLPNVSFLGRIPPEEVTQLLTRSEVSVVPSECDENCSLSIIEALCCGTPVVASCSGGNPELVSPERGILFKRGDITMMREAIRQLLARPIDHKTLAEDAQAEFSPAAYADRITTLIARGQPEL